MKIVGVESLLYGVDDLDRACRFWTDFGLHQVDRDAGRATFETAEGSTIVLRSLDAADLPASKLARNTVHEITWAVEQPSDLAEIAGALAGAAGLQVERDVVRANDPNGYKLAFRVTRRRPIEPADDVYNHARTINRRARRAKHYDQAVPQLMSHVVFFAPKFEEAQRFYIDRLKFQMTDIYPDHAVFLKANGSHEHHNLFFIHENDMHGFHHVAFEVRSIHELFGGGLHMSDCGWKTLMGPGRHPVSSAYFWYFVNPCGGAAEYDWDSDVVDEDWVAQEWPKNHSTFAEWVVPKGISRFRGFDQNDAMIEHDVIKALDEKTEQEAKSATAPGN